MQGLPISHVWLLGRPCVSFALPETAAVAAALTPGCALLCCGWDVGEVIRKGVLSKWCVDSEISLSGCFVPKRDFEITVIDLSISRNPGLAGRRTWLRSLTDYGFGGLRRTPWGPPIKLRILPRRRVSRAIPVHHQSPLFISPFDPDIDLSSFHSPRNHHNFHTPHTHPCNVSTPISPSKRSRIFFDPDDTNTPFVSPTHDVAEKTRWRGSWLGPPEKPTPRFARGDCGRPEKQNPRFWRGD